MYDKEQNKHAFAMKLVDNFSRYATIAHLKNKPILFEKGEPFYTEMKEQGIYKKELPNGEVQIVKRHVSSNWMITEELIENYNNFYEGQ